MSPRDLILRVEKRKTTNTNNKKGDMEICGMAAITQKLYLILQKNFCALLDCKLKEKQEISESQQMGATG